MNLHFPTVPVETARSSSPLPGPEWVRPLVLIVDDEPLITETLAAILYGSGFAALTAPHAEAALEIARLTPPELLISDICMPGMGGIELAVEITTRVPDCEVILFSGHASASDMSPSSRSAGRDFAFLLKPVHPADLLEQAFEKIRNRVPPTCLPRISRNPSLYDFLSSAGHGPEVFQSAWSMTMRSRGRTRPAMAPEA